MNAAIYTRTAVPNPAAHRRQRARCLQLADQLGLDATHEYHDDGKSRPTLDLLLPEILAGSVSTLIIASIDRLGRSITDNERTS
ncbi:recombinase family protein [Microbacterium lacticum]|uniref:recombinase family protein n=1 Tax=Microbacterium lacticum TaxID=33885 RepID=UPI0018B0A06D|nr:recombinase family protein [Microbacterium lacticum]MBF9336193.1 recombinase family protein [Microbacterium lacticum]